MMKFMSRWRSVPRVACFVLLLIGCEARPVPFPAALTKFTPIGDAPVFQGQPGAWDAFIRERGWIVVDDGVWKLYYTGYDDPKGLRRLGLATSPDGLHWTRHSNNPLVADEWIEDVTIVRDGPVWRMVAEGRDDQAHHFTSRDSLAWTRVGPLDVRQADGQPIPPGPYGTPTVIRGPDAWFLLYERGDAGVWLATSTDFQTWRNVRDEPVMTPGPDDHDRDLIALNQVIRRGNRYYALYHGCKNEADKTKRRWSTCLAASDDLIHWTKFPGNPLVPLDKNRSSGIVVPVESGYRLYTMHPEVWAYRN